MNVYGSLAGPPQAFAKGYKTFAGADERSRTSDLLITNQLLYQLSYIGVATQCSRRIASTQAAV